MEKLTPEHDPNVKPRYERFGSDGSDLIVDGEPLTKAETSEVDEEKDAEKEKPAK